MPAQIELSGAPALRNQILRNLGFHEREPLLPLLRPVSFEPGVMLRPTRPSDDCLFIENGIAALLCEPAGLDPVEVGLVGREGMLGLFPILGSDKAMHSAMTVTPCDAWAVSASDLRYACGVSRPLNEALLRYASARLAEAMRRSACHLQHRLEQRLADWILITTERLHVPRLSITHKQLSQFLGATRPGITLAIQDLEGRQAIRAKRNLITVRSRAILGQISCGCYGAGLDDGPALPRDAAAEAHHAAHQTH